VERRLLAGVRLVGPLEASPGTVCRPAWSGRRSRWSAELLAFESPSATAAPPRRRLRAGRHPARLRRRPPVRGCRTGLAAGPATLTLLDAVGRVVRTRTVPLAAGSQQAALDMADLAPGVYALRVAVGGSGGTTRLVVE
jgi:hypothetical protein